jgi:hypothetical protein
MPAGWYPDPSGFTTKLRYWNGYAWTDGFMDAPAVTQTDLVKVSTGADPYRAYNPYASYVQPIAAPVNDGSGMAVASLVLGIIGVPCCICAPFYIVQLLAIIFGVLGLKSSKRGMAIAGLVLGSSIIALGLISLFIYIVVLGFDYWL